jgi:uncharacterized membrane protein YbhN (UPF0104 family)
MSNLNLTALRQRYGRWATSPAARLLRIALVAAALGLMAWSLIAATRDLHARGDTVDLHLAGIGFLYVLVASLLGSAVWWTMLRAFQLRTPWRQSIVIHMASNVAKYIPGYGWHYVSKGYFLQESAATTAVFWVIVSELLIVLSSGAVLGLAATGLYALPILGRSLSPFLIWALVLVLLGGTIAWTIFVHRRLVASSAVGHTWRQRVGAVAYSGIAWLLAALGWLAFAAAIHLFIMALDSSLTVTYPQSLMALTFASIVSMLVIFVPAGLGVREVTLAALLAPAVPLALGVTVSILLRFAVVVSELLQLGLVLFWTKHWPENLRTTLFLEKQAKNTPNGLL